MFTTILLQISLLLGSWTIESEDPACKVTNNNDTLELQSLKGITVWYNQKLEGDVTVEYDACLMDEGREGDRVSDMNCFWMASDPMAKDGSVFRRLKQRGGAFANSYQMQLYYMGYGGNNNTTTRFRRYAAEGNGELDDKGMPVTKPAVLVEYTDPAHLNVPNKWRHIRVETYHGRTRYFMDGECLVDYNDPEPLTSGWFGLRSTWSRMKVTGFKVTRHERESVTGGIALHSVEPTQAELATVRFGVPFDRGEVSTADRFAVSGSEMDFFPLTYWPDGSVKWGGFAGVVNMQQDLSLVRLGKKAKRILPSLSVRQSDGQIIVSNDSVTAYIASSEGSRCLIDSIVANNRTTATGVRLTGSMSDGMSDTGVLRKFEVERHTPGLIVLRAEQSLMGMTNIVRISMMAGSSEVKLTHTLIYNNPNEGNPGDLKHLGIQSLALAADVPLHEQAYNRHVVFGSDSIWHEPVQPLTGRRVISLPDQAPKGARATNPVVYKQQVAGERIPEPDAFDEVNQRYIQHWATWDSYRLSQLNDEGFSIRKSAKGVGITPWIGTMSGHRSSGKVFVGEVSGGVSVAMDDFWQSFPSTMLVSGMTRDTATVSMYMWSPESEAMDLRHYDTVAHDLDASYEDVQEGMSTPQGIGRTTSLRLRPVANSLLANVRQSFADEVQLSVSPDYLHSRRAFGVWSLPSALYPELEADLTYWMDFMVREVDRRHWYGYWNYGDVMHAFDEVRGDWRYDVGGFAWDNTELASNMMLWYNYLRTGRADMWRMAVAMTRHTSEVDVYHEGEWNGLGSRHNVSHWGCGSKEARISQAAWNRFYYYLSGGDERTGELMSAQRDLDTLLYRLDPMRLAQPRGKYPCTAPARLRVGPDWIAYAANWMTEYERTLNTKYWDKIVAGMNSISAMPHGIFSGPKALGYDPATGILSWEGDTAVINTNHLLSLMGGAEVMNEMMLTREVPQSWRQTWLDHCRDYRWVAYNKIHHKYPIPRLSAYAAFHYRDAEVRPAMLREAWYDAMQARPTPTNYSTNSIASWSLDIIYMLEACPALDYKELQKSLKK